MLSKKVPEVQALDKVRFISVGILKILSCEVIGNLTFVQQKGLLQPEDILELIAFYLSRAVNRGTHFEVSRGAVLEGPTMRLLNLVSFTPLPNRKKALEGEPVGINTLVTSMARLVLLVLFDLLPERLGMTMFRFKSRNTLGGRRQGPAHDVPRDPGPAQDWRSIKSIGSHLEHTSHR